MLTVDSITDKLDRLYEFEIDKYIEECKALKKAGYKIYRNDKTGKHKIEEPSRQTNTYSDTNADAYNAFSKLYRNRFSRG